MLAVALCQLNRIDFKGPSVASEGNYITSRLNLLKWILQLYRGISLKMLAVTPSQVNRIDFKGLPVALEGNYITNKLTLLK